MWFTLVGAALALLLHNVAAAAARVERVPMASEEALYFLEPLLVCATNRGVP